jgi:polyisoprenoid-binding protein YceI
MRMKFSCLVIFLFSFMIKISAQGLVTKTGFVGFYSKTPLEDIKAENEQAYAILEPESLRIVFAVLLKGFIFPKELMQEHFNENYVESDKYPKATFSGTCSGDLDLSKEGIYQVVIKGELNLHGVTKSIETTAQIEVKKDKILATSVFNIKPEDFQISIPAIVRDKIASQISVKVQAGWIRTK